MVVGVPKFPKAEKVSKNIFKLGPLGSPKVLCSYLIMDKKTCIVDCGPSSVSDELFETLSELGVKPGDIDGLLLTHIHIDHAGGASNFIKRSPNSHAYVPVRGYKHLLEPSLLNSSAREVLGEHLFDSWGPAKPLPETRLSSMSQDAILDVGSENLRYIEARGHAPHHDVLLLEKQNILFAADALGIHDDELERFHSPTTPPPSFNLDEQRHDFHIIEDLSPKLLCFAHYKFVKPDDSFYSETLSLYSSWERTIGDYLLEKRIKGSKLSEKDIEQIFDRLANLYPVYHNISERMEYQVKRVDITGFARWIDYNTNKN